MQFNPFSIHSANLRIKNLKKIFREIENENKPETWIRKRTQ